MEPATGPPEVVHGWSDGQERLQSSRPAINTEQLLQQLSAQLATLRDGGKGEPLRWIRAQAGKTVRLIAIEDVDYFRSDAKHTLIAWRDGGIPAEAAVRIPLKDLLDNSMRINSRKSIGRSS